MVLAPFVHHTYFLCAIVMRIAILSHWVQFMFPPTRSNTLFLSQGPANIFRLLFDVTLKNPAGTPRSVCCTSMQLAALGNIVDGSGWALICSPGFYLWLMCLHKAWNHQLDTEPERPPSTQNLWPVVDTTTFANETLVWWWSWPGGRASIVRTCCVFSCTSKHQSSVLVLFDLNSSGLAFGL